MSNNIPSKSKVSEEIFKLIPEVANDLIRVVDSKLNVTYLNEDAHKNALDYSWDDLIGKPTRYLIHPDEIQKLIQFLKELRKNGIAKREGRVRHKNGGWKWFDIQAKVFKNVMGEWNTLSISRDISARKRAEQRLKDSEEKYRLIFNNVNDLVGVLNKKFKYEYINETAFQRITGYSSQDLIGNTALKFTHPDDQSSTAKALLEGFKMGKGNHPFRFKHKNGHWVWLEARGKTFHDTDGELKAIVVSRDITDQQLSEQKLRESEEKYRLISENVYDLIGVLNKKFKYEYINEIAFQRILGYSNQEIIGKSSLKFLHPDDCSIAANTLLEGFKNGKGKHTFRFKHKDGHWVWLEARGKTFKDNDGELKGIIVSRDITERKLAENKLKESEVKYRKAYNQLNFYKDLFGHDMNNILAAVKSSAELIPYCLNGPNKSEDIKSLVSILQNQVERGTKLITKVNLLSELENSLKSTKVLNMNNILENAIESTKKLDKEKKIGIDFEVNDEIYLVIANELLREVFENILINGIKYNSNPSISIKIKCSKVSINSRKYVRVEFIDNGIGVPDDRKELIFKPGNRELKGSKGMGIGLSLVKRIIKSYKGKIWVEDNVKSDNSQGSNFIILIPEALNGNRIN